LASRAALIRCNDMAGGAPARGQLATIVGVGCDGVRRAEEGRSDHQEFREMFSIRHGGHAADKSFKTAPWCAICQETVRREHHRLMPRVYKSPHNRVPAKTTKAPVINTSATISVIM